MGQTPSIPASAYLNDSKYVFRSCQRDWIVVMEKLPDTKTDEDRPGVIDPSHAEFRANKLRVVSIINKNDLSTTRQVKEEILVEARGCVCKTITFTVGRKVSPPWGYEECWIRYYKIHEPAHYDELQQRTEVRKHWYPSGRLKWEVRGDVHQMWNAEGVLICKTVQDGPRSVDESWYDEGQPESIKHYLDTKLDGPFRVWYPNGKLKEEGFCVGGKLDGVYKSWHPSGTLSVEGFYVGGKEEGLYRAWYPSGVLSKEFTLVNHRLEGTYRSWYPSESLAEEGVWREGKLEGTYRSWHPSGWVAKEFRCSSGVPVGIWSKWKEDGTLYEELGFNFPETITMRKLDYYPETSFLIQAGRRDVIWGLIKEFCPDGFRYMYVDSHQ